MSNLGKTQADKMAQAIENRLQQIAKQVYRQVPNDREVEGIVVAFDNIYNTYTVKINNKDYTKIPQDRGIGSISLNTRVKVKVPNNQMSNAYICGIVDGSIVDSGSSLPLGMIISSAVVQTDAGLHLLDGSEHSTTGIYTQFCTWLIAKYNADNTSVPVVNGETDAEKRANYDAEVNATGQCGKFIIGSNFIRLPKITKFIEGLNSLSDLGTRTDAGLPNITGQFAGILAGSEGGAGTHNGAFRLGGNASGNNWGGNSGWNNTMDETFDASLGEVHNGSYRNDIYGKSDTVQPQSIKYPYYIVVATIVKTQITVDLDQYISDLNLKANKDLSNSTVPHIIQTYVNGASGYRIWSDGYCKQWGRKTNVSSSGSTQVDLLKTFVDTNYLVLLTTNEAVAGSNKQTAWGLNTTYFMVSSENTKTIGWESSGFLAQGEY